MWWLAQPQADAPALLYLHGTFRNLQDNQRKIAALYAAGFSVLAVDYRGWGASTSIIPSEQTIVQDAQVAWKELVRRQPRAASRVIYGHSMGSGVAVSLASSLAYPADYDGLILESAFTSFDDVAHEAGFWATLLQHFGTEHFASIDKIGQIHAPVLMLHGELDDTIPIRLGRRLFDAANEPKQWLSMTNGHHSDLDDIGHEPYLRALQSFQNIYLTAPLAPQAPDSQKAGTTSPTAPDLPATAAPR